MRGEGRARAGMVEGGGRERRRGVREGEYRVEEERGEGGRDKLHVFGVSVGGLGKQPLEVLTISDIEKDYVLVHTKLTLIQRDPTLITQLSGMYYPNPDHTAIRYVISAGFNPNPYHTVCNTRVYP